MKNKMCYIVVVHYNSEEDTIQCISSILNSSYSFYEIIIVNNSITTSIKKIKNKYSNNNKITLINSSNNNGYGYGLNIGIKYALKQKDCKFVLLLNNDTFLFKNTLSEFILSDESTKVDTLWGAKILNNDKSIQSLGCKINKYFMTTTHNYNNYNDNKEDFTIKKIDYIHGCCFFFNIKIVDKIGFFNEDYFLFYEDVDYSFRARINNVKLNICQKSKIIHKQNSSISKKKLHYLSIVNRIIFAKNYFNNNLVFVYLGIIYEFIKNIFLFRYNRNIKMLKYFYS